MKKTMQKTVQRGFALLLALLMALPVLALRAGAAKAPGAPTGAEPNEIIMTATEFIDMLKYAASCKTLYVMGCFGAPMNATNKERYKKNHDYNMDPTRQAMIDAATADTFGFDCVNLVKGILWGWDGNVNHVYGGAKYKTRGVPDVSANGMIKQLYDVSTDFSDILPGEGLWIKGHFGVYIGDRQAIECTPRWENCVQYTNMGNLGNNSGHSRNWTKHGKLPWVSYDGSAPPPPPPPPALDPAYAGDYECTTVNDDLKIRSGPGTENTIVGSIPPGGIVHATGATGPSPDGWAYVEYDGVSGYSSMRYLKKVLLPHTVTFTVNGAFYASQTHKAGEAIEAPEYEVPEGGRFSGWQIPQAMPDRDIALDATLSFLPGDVDFSGEADNLDAVLVLEYDAGVVELAENRLAAGDVNGDGETDNLDAVLILEYDAGLIESLGAKPCKTSPENTNYAANSTYTVTKNGDSDPANIYLAYDSGKTLWADLDCTKLKDGIVGDPSAYNGTDSAMRDVTVQYVGTGAEFGFCFDLGDRYGDIRSLVFRNVRHGTPNGNNRGFSLCSVEVSDDGESWRTVTGALSGVPVAGAVEIASQLVKDECNVEHFDFTYTLDEAAKAKFVKVTLSNDGGYVLQFEELEIRN